MGAAGPDGPRGPSGSTSRVKTLRTQDMGRSMESFFTGSADGMLTTSNASTAVYTSAASLLNN